MPRVSDVCLSIRAPGLAVAWLAVSLCMTACTAVHVPCNPVDTSLLASHAGAMLGEIHGTTEAPQFVGRAVCSIARSGRPVVLALEYPREEQASLDAFFDNPDREAAGKALLKTQFWSEVPGDGRESQGWFTLLHNVRAWKAQHLPLTVVAYDYWPPGGTDNDREAANARFLAEVLEKAKGRAFVVTYSGNVHAMKVKGLAGLTDDAYESMGYRLKDWDLLHLNVGYMAGQAWMCTTADLSDCGPHLLMGNVTRVFKPYSMHLGYPSPNYDGVFSVGTLTPSPPARLDGAH